MADRFDILTIVVRNDGTARVIGPTGRERESAGHLIVLEGEAGSMEFRYPPDFTPGANDADDEIFVPPAGCFYCLGGHRLCYCRLGMMPPTGGRF